MDPDVVATTGGSLTAVMSMFLDVLPDCAPTPSELESLKVKVTVRLLEADVGSSLVEM